MLIKLAAWMSHLVVAIGALRARINERARDRYNPAHLALAGCGLALILIVVMLFSPPYLGVSNDGRFEAMMNSVGISYIHEDDAGASGYYVPRYRVTGEITGDMRVSPATVMFLRMAVAIDGLITRDDVFDLRFPAAMYAGVFLFALYVIILQAQRRVKSFTECVVIVLIAVVIFADVAYATFFASLYPEPMLFLALLLAVGTALSFENERRDRIKLAILFGSCVVLAFTAWAGGIAACAIAVYMVKLAALHKQFWWKFSCVACALLTAFCAMFSFAHMAGDVSDAGKYHAMTRGVLTHAADPEETLAEFGISPGYSMLADVSAYDRYPFVLPDEGVVDKGFLDQYDFADILAYYARHPGAMLSMVNLAVESSFILRPDYSGNYEKSMNMPFGAKSLFFASWSTFKSQSAPQTGAFVVALIILAAFLFRKVIVHLIREWDARLSIPLEVSLVVFAIGALTALVAIITGGDAELYKYRLFLSLAVDLLIYIVFSELLHKLNIIGGDGI